MTRLTYEDWRDFLFRIQAICSPAELHGSAVGYACGTATKGLKAVKKSKDDTNPWLVTATQVMDLQAGDLDEAVQAGLGALLDTVMVSLKDDSYAFTLLLPDDALPLADRIRAVSEWAQGFLNGLGQAAAGIGQQLDADTQAFLQDLAEIIQVDTNSDEEEQNEIHMVELVEYVRMGTISMYIQLTQPWSSQSGENKSNLH